MSLCPRTFRKAALGVGAAAFVGASVLSAFPAAAEQAALSPKQCQDAQIIANAVMGKYKVSPELAGSFGRFVFSKCDMGTDWKLASPVDEKAFGEFRVRLVAMRMANAGKPETLVTR